MQISLCSFTLPIYVLLVSFTLCLRPLTSSNSFERCIFLVDCYCFEHKGISLLIEP
ncbi:hypothetical protein BDW75DRAFT_208396 [Aspergillus navahoensis]